MCVGRQDTKKKPRAIPTAPVEIKTTSSLRSPTAKLSENEHNDKIVLQNLRGGLSTQCVIGT